MRLGQVRHDVAPAFVGDRDLGEAGAELGGLRDDPHAGFRTEPAGDHAADIVVVDGNRRGGVLLSPQLGREPAASIATTSTAPAQNPFPAFMVVSPAALISRAFGA